LAFTTPVAFFASRLMPDMFAGIARWRCSV
jgi:hypothetical protein